MGYEFDFNKSTIYIKVSLDRIHIRQEYVLTDENAGTMGSQEPNPYISPRSMDSVFMINA